MPGHIGLQELIARHCETLRINADLLSAFLAQMADPENVSGQPARDALHFARRIAGAGRSVGFAEINAIASDIEHALEPIVAVNGVPSPAQKERIDLLMAALQKAAGEIHPEMSTLHSVNVSAIDETRRRA